MKNDVFYNALRDKIVEKYDYWRQIIKDDDVFDFAEYDLSECIDSMNSFKLYRYMPANYYNIRNIETQKIHLSCNGVMNDIYEGLPISEEGRCIDYYEQQKLKDLAYMTCFSETNDNSLMWSHYAKQHEGMCVEYDFKKLKNNGFDILKHLFPVVYCDKRIIKRNMKSLIQSLEELGKAIDGSYVYEGEEALDDILPLFLTKAKVWEYEREWRLLYTKMHMYEYDDKVLYQGNIEMQCISAVYFGYRTDPEIKKNIIEICQRISNSSNIIRIFQAKLDNEGYDILFDEM